MREREIMHTFFGRQSLFIVGSIVFWLPTLDGLDLSVKQTKEDLLKNRYNDTIEPLSDTYLVDIIEHRFYVIRCLSYAMESLSATERTHEASMHPVVDQKLLPKLNVYQLNIEGYKSERVKGIAQELQSTQQLEVLGRGWEHFAQYRGIGNQNIERDFALLLLNLYRQLLINEKSTDLESIDGLFEQAQEYSIGQLISVLSRFVDKYNELSGRTHFRTPPLSRAEVMQMSLSVSTDEIMKRFYLVTRLERALTIISSIVHNPVSLPANFYTKFASESLEHFKSILIRQCLECIEKSKTLEPLLFSWRYFAAYRSINDLELARELIVLMFSVLQQLSQFIKLSTTPDQSILDTQESSGLTMQDLAALYNDLASLPTAEILEAVDELVDTFDAIMEKYVVKDGTQWTRWLRRYGATASVFSIGAIISFQYYLKHRGYL